MENQHRSIKGYRELSQEEIDLMNEIKAKGEELKALIEKIDDTHDVDGDWLYIGSTHLRQGIMALVRAVAKPESF